MHEVDTCLEAKSRKLFWGCFHLHFCAHMILSYVNEWHVLPYGLNCPFKISTPLQKSAKLLLELLCCNLVQQPLPSQLKFFMLVINLQLLTNHQMFQTLTKTSKPQSFVMSSSSTDTLQIIASSDIFWNWLFTKYPIIQHYIVWATENMRVIWKWSKRE